MTRLLNTTLSPLLLMSLLNSNSVNATQGPSQQELESAPSNKSDWMLIDHDYLG